MRAGRLTHPINLLELNGKTRLTVWGDIQPPAKGSDQVQTGIRSPVTTVIRMRHCSGIYAGDLLQAGIRLYIVEQVHNKDDRNRELWLNCTALEGRPAIYLPVIGEPYSILAFVSKNAPYVGVNGDVIEYRNKIEVPKIQLKTAYTFGDQVTIEGQIYDLQGIAEGGDDGTVIQFMA